MDSEDGHKGTGPKSVHWDRMTSLLPSASVRNVDVLFVSETDGVARSPHSTTFPVSLENRGFDHATVV